MGGINYSSSCLLSVLGGRLDYAVAKARDFLLVVRVTFHSTLAHLLHYLLRAGAVRNLQVCGELLVGAYVYFLDSLVFFRLELLELRRGLLVHKTGH